MRNWFLRQDNARSSKVRKIRNSMTVNRILKLQKKKVMSVLLINFKNVIISALPSSSSLRLQIFSCTYVHWKLCHFFRSVARTAYIGCEIFERKKHVSHEKLANLLIWNTILISLERTPNFPEVNPTSEYEKLRVTFVQIRDRVPVRLSKL